MNQSIYVLCQLIVIFLVAFVVFSIIYALRSAYTSMNINEKRRDTIIRWVGLSLGLWLLITGLLSWGGYYSNFKYLPPRIFVLGLLPPLILAIILLFSKGFTKILRHIPPKWLIQVQSFRIAMELMLWLGLIGGFVPFQMTFEGFNMDFIVGITALFAARLFFGRGRFLRFEAAIWNIFGTFLLVNILFIAIISTPSPFRVFMNEPANEFIAFFPFIWIPAFIVPFALAIHLFSLKQVLVIEKRNY